MQNIRTPRSSKEDVLKHYWGCLALAETLFGKFSERWMHTPNLNLCGVSPSSILRYADGHLVLKALLVCIRNNFTVNGHNGEYRREVDLSLSADSDALEAFILVYDSLTTPCKGVPDIDSLYANALTSIKYTKQRFCKHVF